MRLISINERFNCAKKLRCKKNLKTEVVFFQNPLIISVVYIIIKKV